MSEVKKIGFTKKDVARFKLQKNDVLVVEGHASVDEIGRAAIWSGKIENCLHQNHLFRIRCNGGLQPEFVLAFLNSPKGRLYFKIHAKSTSGLNTINSQVLNKMPLVIPPLDEQRLIVEVLQEFDQRQKKLEIHLSLQTELKKSLLAKFIINNSFN